MNKKDPRVIKTLERISEAVLANLEQHPFREITLNMICQDAMINKTTFYKYYRDKYDYLNQYLDARMEQFRKQLDAAFLLASPESIDSPVYQEHFARLLRYIYRHRREYLILWRAGIDRKIYDEMGEAIYDALLLKILDSPDFDAQPRIQMELYARLFASHTMTLLHWWFHHEEVTMDNVLRLMTDNMKHGFFKAFKSLPPG